MRRAIFSYLTGALSISGAMAMSSPALAGPLQPCSETSLDFRSLAIGEHGEGVRTFYDGRVLLVKIDEGEPAAGPAGFVLVLPSPDEDYGGSVCLAARYFYDIDIDHATSSYDPATGLAVRMTERRWDPETSRERGSVTRTLHIDMARGNATLD